jgi:hypothetical protein
MRSGGIPSHEEQGAADQTAGVGLLVEVDRTRVSVPIGPTECRGPFVPRHVPAQREIGVKSKNQGPSGS